MCDLTTYRPKLPTLASTRAFSLPRKHPAKAAPGVAQCGYEQARPLVARGIGGAGHQGQCTLAVIDSKVPWANSKQSRLSKVAPPDLIFQSDPSENGAKIQFVA